MRQFLVAESIRKEGTPSTRRQLVRRPANVAPQRNVCGFGIQSEEALVRSRRNVLTRRSRLSASCCSSAPPVLAIRWHGGTT
jgi:hypothetical protein